MKITRTKDFNLIERFLSENFSSPTHWPEWNQIISKYYNTDFYYIVLENKGTISGICPIHGEENRVLNLLYSGQFNYIPYGGWIFKNNEIVDKKHFPLKYNQILTGFSLPTGGNFPNYSMKLKSTLFSTLTIDLDHDENWIWENCIDSKRRNMIRKAQKNQVFVDEVTLENYSTFYAFYTESNTRYNLTCLAKDCLAELLFSTKSIKFHATLVKYENKIISSHVMVSDKNIALYWMGLNAVLIPNLGQGELLQWMAIKNAKKFGCKFYDLCYIEKERLPKIHEFKKGFSQNESQIVNFCVKPLSYRIINRIQK